MLCYFASSSSKLGKCMFLNTLLDIILFSLYYWSFMSVSLTHFYNSFVYFCSVCSPIFIHLNSDLPSSSCCGTFLPRSTWQTFSSLICLSGHNFSILTCSYFSSQIIRFHLVLRKVVLTPEGSSHSRK